MRTRVVDWVFTLPFLAAFGGILLLFEPIQRVARLFGQRPQEVAANGMQICLVWAMRLTGMRLEVERSTDVKPHTSYLVIANHQSMFDIPILGSLLTSNYPKYVAKRELARRIPSISYNLQRGGHAIIDRADRGQATRVISELGQQVRERGVSAMIFPEGTRAREGELGRFRPAGVRSLLEAAPEIPVVPITIDQSWRLLRFNLMPVPFGVHVRVSIGDPMPRQPGEDTSVLIGEVKQEIEKTLARWRSA